MSLNVKKSTYIIRTPAFYKYKLKPANYKLLLKNDSGLINLSSISNQHVINNIMDGNVQLIDIIKSFKLESIIKPEKKKKVTVKGAKKLVLI